MSLAKEIWDKLSIIDVSSKTEKKGQFTYLSWAWAWDTFSEHYPDCDYKMAEQTFDDGTMEVHCSMTVYRDEEKVNRFMWLPVLNFNNKAIVKPNSYDINTARMRCLVKCLAMYGLGHYIYAGEDIPKEKSNEEYKNAYRASVDAIKAGIASGDYSTAAEEWFTLSEEAKKGLWIAPSKGGLFSSQEREIIKSTEFRVSYYGEPT